MPGELKTTDLTNELREIAAELPDKETKIRLQDLADQLEHANKHEIRTHENITARRVFMSLRTQGDRQSMREALVEIEQLADIKGLIDTGSLGHRLMMAGKLAKLALEVPERNCDALTDGDNLEDKAVEQFEAFCRRLNPGPEDEGCDKCPLEGEMRHGIPCSVAWLMARKDETYPKAE